MIPCSVDGCGQRRSGTHGYCGKHLYRFKKYGDPLKVLEYEESAPVAPEQARPDDLDTSTAPVLTDMTQNYLHVTIDISGNAFTFDYQIPDAPGNIKESSVNRGWLDEHVRASLKPLFGRMVGS